jgi:hypothetical protein
MKTIKLILSIIFIVGLSSCTKDFVDINKNPNAITPDEASARYFITNPEYILYAPDRYPYWRAHLIHTDRYAGYFTFGFSGCWWSDELGYKYNSGYTDAAWDWLEGYFNQIDNFMRLTGPGGDFENDRMYAVGQIIKSLYYQMFTDVFGEIPFTEAGDPDITTPKFDMQNTIYQGLIDMLDAAMGTIGDETTTGDGVNDLGDNDVIFNGDLQKWKKLANSLKLRLAMRARGADGADWVQGVVTSAMDGPFIETGEDAILPKDDEISQWTSSCYGDVWYNFGLGSNWTVGKFLIDYMRNNDDPRLPMYAQPAPGGTFRLYRPDAENNTEGYENFPARIDYLHTVLNEATGGDMTYTDWTDSVEISIPENKYYIGQPPRLNAQIQPFTKYEFFSIPAEYIIQQKNKGQSIKPDLIMGAAEVYFLRAEAVVRGLATGDASGLFQDGIRASMQYWGVDDASIEEYIANAPLAQLTGSTDQQLEKIGVQRWIAHYTDGFEGWADIRKLGYPVEMAQGVSNTVIFGLGDDNGVLPERMRYGNSAYNNNLDMLNAAISRQGPDVQGTKLWWAK